ncbi:MAG: tetratricopeptide repeat protein [Candidatus Omnitrophota bacterium]
MFLILLPCFKVSAREYIDKDKFFSYKRFFLDQDVIDRIPEDGRTQRDLNMFAKRFTDGLYAFSGGDLKVAEKDLLEARKIWPEYFGADFLLARLYEETGNPGKAARYYKSYLNKLKKFHAGEYRISGPLIRIFASDSIERFGPAREAVKERLSLYGINLDRVRPVYTFPVFLMPILAGLALGLVYVVTVYHLVPYLKKQRLVRNPPEGFWICRNCGTSTPELSKVCEKCGRSHE